MKLRYKYYEPRDYNTDNCFGNIGDKTDVKDCFGNDLYIGDVILPLDGFGHYTPFLCGSDAFILTKRDVNVTITTSPLMRGEKDCCYYYPYNNSNNDPAFVGKEREYGESYFRLKSYKQLSVGEQWGLHLCGLNDESSVIVEVVE